jgi:hypothetical protein
MPNFNPLVFRTRNLTLKGKDQRAHRCSWTIRGKDASGHGAALAELDFKRFILVSHRRCPSKVDGVATEVTNEFSSGDVLP